MTRLKSLIALAVLLTLALAGCGSKESAASGTIKVGVIPVIDAATIYLAQDEGYFKKHGLSVELQSMDNGAAIAPAVLNGQLQVGSTANVPYLTAKSKGLPLLAFANGSSSTQDRAGDTSGLFVAKGSDIKSPGDLAGKTVATNNLRNVLQLAVDQLVKDDGGDPSKVKYVAMPFPNMTAALERGDVDAISIVEPFFSTAQASGATLLANPYAQAFEADTSMAIYLSSEAWLKDNPKQAKDFAAALSEASDFAAENPQAVRDVAVKHLGMDAALAAEVRLPAYGAELNGASLERLADMMTGYKFIDAKPSGDLVWQP